MLTHYVDMDYILWVHLRVVNANISLSLLLFKRAGEMFWVFFPKLLGKISCHLRRGCNSLHFQRSAECLSSYWLESLSESSTVSFSSHSLIDHRSFWDTENRCDLHPNASSVRLCSYIQEYFWYFLKAFSKGFWMLLFIIPSVLVLNPTGRCIQYLAVFVYTCLSVHVRACMYVCVCVSSGIMIDWQWERKHHPKLVEKPYIPGLQAVNPSTDYRLKHAARSHQCFSKYFQSQCLEIIASGQEWDWFPKQALCVLWLSGFIERWKWKKIGFTCSAKALGISFKDLNVLKQPFWEICLYAFKLNGTTHISATYEATVSQKHWETATLALSKGNKIHLLAPC